MAYETLLVETDGPVGIITLNRPDALNALNRKLCEEVIAALDAFEADANIGCVVLTGAGRAFAAGADIKEMAPQSYMDVYKADMFGAFEQARLHLPQADHRRGQWLCPRRRLRARDDVRFHPRV